MVCGILFLCVGTTLVSGSIADAPRPAMTVSISGTVYGLPLDGTGPTPVEGAKVALVGGKLIGGLTFAVEKSLPTDASGYYSFSDIPVGLFILFARKPGEYLPSFRIVRLTASQPVKQNQDINLIRIGGGNKSQMQTTVSAFAGSFEGSIGPKPHGNQTLGNISGAYLLRNRGGRFNGTWDVTTQNITRTGTMRGVFRRVVFIGRIMVDGVNRTIPLIGFIRAINGSFVGRFMAPRGPALYFWGTYL